MSNMWQKIVSMVRKTGDRCIVFDSQIEDAYVVMDFRSYERIIERNHPKTPPPSHHSGHIQPIIETFNRIELRSTPRVEVQELERLTQKPNPDTINPDFDIPLPEVPEADEDLPLGSFVDLSAEAVGSPSHFYLEPIE